MQNENQNVPDKDAPIPPDHNAQASVVVNGVPTAAPVSPPGEELPHKSGFFSFRAPSQRFVNGLLLANVVLVFVPTAFYFYLLAMAKSGTSGTEFLAIPLLLLIPLILGVIAANLITLPLYLLKSKPSAGYTVLACVTFLFSLFVAGSFVYGLANRNPDQYTRSATSSSSSPTTFSDGYKSITKDKAVELINSCQVDDLVGYTREISLVDSNAREGVERAEKYANGVAVYLGTAGRPTLIYASKAVTPELVAAARLARDKCAPQKELKIYLDNTAELKASNGTWQTVTAP